MSRSKTQSFPQDMDGNTPARRFKFYQRPTKTTPNERFRNDPQVKQQTRYGQYERKTPGSFAKTYGGKNRRRTENSLRPSGSKYSREEKLKLIKEFESTGAPLALFSKWYGIGMNTFRRWLEKLQKYGEAGLDDSRAGSNRVELPEPVKNEIIRIKLENPGIGAGKIAQWLARHMFYNAGSRKVREVLLGNLQTEPLMHDGPRVRHGNSGKEPQHFERSRAREMYQMDIMTFMLQGLYRVYVIACLDDYSRFVVSIGLFRRQTTDRCLDVLRSAIERYGMPKEMLTDNGRQFYTWRGISEFQKYLVKCGIKHTRSRPYHPQTLGKIESLWRNMYQEFLGKEPLNSFEDAEAKIAKWIEWYNFRRPHQGIGGLVPADRFFGVDKSMRDLMDKGAGIVKESLAADPRQAKPPVYLIGQVDGKEIRIIAKDGSVTLNNSGETNEVIPKEEKNDIVADTGGAGGSGQESGTNGQRGQAAQEDRCREKVQDDTGNTQRKEDEKTGPGGDGREQAGDLDVGKENRNGIGGGAETGRPGAEEKGICAGQSAEEGTGNGQKQPGEGGDGEQNTEGKE